MFALRFMAGFMLSQWVFRDAKTRGISAASLVSGLKAQLIGTLVEARYPETFKAQMLDEIGQIADQVVANAETFDSLGQPDF